MKKTARKSTARVVNRRAKFDYELGESLVVGIQLTGKETKALRFGHGQLAGAYVTLKDGELWLVGAQVNSGKGATVPEDEKQRTRKLLAHAREIESLSFAKQQGRTIVPLEFLTESRYIKLRIATGRGKKKYDKRETLKRRQQEREIARNSG